MDTGGTGFQSLAQKSLLYRRKKIAKKKVLQFTNYDLKNKKKENKKASERGLEEGQKSSNGFAKHSKVLSLHCTTFKVSSNGFAEHSKVLSLHCTTNKPS